MVGIRLFPIGFRPIFRGKLAVSFREGRIPVLFPTRTEAHLAVDNPAFWRGFMAGFPAVLRFPGGKPSGGKELGVGI